MIRLYVSDCEGKEIVFLGAEQLGKDLVASVWYNLTGDPKPSDEDCALLVPIINKAISKENEEYNRGYRLIDLDDLLTGAWLWEDTCPLDAYPIVYISKSRECSDSCKTKNIKNYKCKFNEV